MITKFKLPLHISTTILLTITKHFTHLTNHVKHSTTITHVPKTSSNNLKPPNPNNPFVLNPIPTYPHLYSCTKLIQTHLRENRFRDALNVFDEMPVRDSVTWNSMLKGCFDYGFLDVGFELFGVMPERNVVSWTTVVNGLLRYGRVEDAERLFGEMPVKDEAAWNAMVYGCIVNGRVEDGVRLFGEMTVKSVVSWTAVISGLDQAGRSEDGLVMFKKMLGCGVRATAVTFTSVLTACVNVEDLCLGVVIHGHVVKCGCCLDTYIVVPLITLYARCKDIDSCYKVFSETSDKSVVVWTSLLTGYGLNCKYEKALEVFRDMFRSGILPNQSSFTSALNSCCELEDLDKGREINGVVIKFGLESDAFVGNSLIVLYTKCGNINDGLSVFKEIADKNIVSWNSMIVGCAQHGYGMWALVLFNRMIRYGVPPDDITFTGLLSACSRSGMLDKGKCIFDFLLHYESVTVKLEHYACIVDILGRKGNLNEAEELVKSMPMEPNRSIWLSLLSACKIHSNIKLAERAAEAIFAIDHDCSAAYTLLSGLYASSGRWKDASRIQGLMKRRLVIKEPGHSWIPPSGEIKYLERFGV